MKGPVVVIKVGGGAITKKESQVPCLEVNNLDRFCAGLAALTDDHRVVLVSGAGSFGHALAKQHGFSSRPQLHAHNSTNRTNAALAVRRQVIELTSHIQEHSQQVPVLPLHPLWDLDGDALAPLSDAARASIHALLDQGIVPLYHGDMILHANSGPFVLSGDVIAPFLARELDATQLVFCSSCPLYDRNPSEEPTEAKVITTVHVTLENLAFHHGDEIVTPSFATTAARSDVTGAMSSKLHHAVDFVRRQPAATVCICDVQHLEAAVRRPTHPHVTLIDVLS